MDEHFRVQGFVGTELVARLGNRLHELLLVPRARLPLLIVGAAGSGRTLTAKLCHRVAASSLGRSGQMISIDLNGSEDVLESRSARQNLLALASGGTLVLDGVDGLSRKAQPELAGLVRELEQQQLDGVPSPVLLLLARNDRPARLEPAALPQLLDGRLAPALELPPLFSRGPEIQELAQHFLAQLAAEECPGRTLQFTRRALSDLRQGMELKKIASVRALRDLVLDAVHPALEAGTLPDRIPSELVLPLLLGPGTAQELQALQAERDLAELAAGIPDLVDRAMLVELAHRHAVSTETLESFCKIMGALLQGNETGNRLSYPQIVERARVVSRVALWLISGARTQSDFRHFFGNETWQMPTKSVAWAIFHEVLGGPDEQELQQ